MMAARWGPAFEAHLRASGIDLPPGTRGADIIFAIHEGWLTNLTEDEQEFFSKGVSLGLGPVADIIRSLATELADGTADKGFREQLLKRVKAWAATKRHPGIGGAASA